MPISAVVFPAPKPITRGRTGFSPRSHGPEIVKVRRMGRGTKPIKTERIGEGAERLPRRGAKRLHIDYIHFYVYILKRGAGDGLHLGCSI